MANNFKIFDENKSNMLSTEEYNNSSQRMNGVQIGIASSQLHNKAMYQTSLMAYALAQLMSANGIDASDEQAVLTFVNNLSSTLLQKNVDKATVSQAISGTNNTKWMSPYLVSLFYNSATTIRAKSGTYVGNGQYGESNPTTIDVGGISPNLVFIFSPNSQYSDQSGNTGYTRILILYGLSSEYNTENNFLFRNDTNYNVVFNKMNSISSKLEISSSNLLKLFATPRAPQVTNSQAKSYQCNSENATYYWFAFEISQ